MKTKEDVIKEAWLDSEAPYLEYNNTDGWSIRHDIKHKDININCFDWVCNLGGYKIRPKSLKGIENNNMWIRIESESDLPKKTIECVTCFNDGKNYILGDTRERNPIQLWKSFIMLFSLVIELPITIGVL